MFLTLPYPVRERVIALNDASWTVKLSSYNIFHLEKALVKASAGHLDVGRLLYSVPARHCV